MGGQKKAAAETLSLGGGGPRTPGVYTRAAFFNSAPGQTHCRRRRRRTTRCRFVAPRTTPPPVVYPAFPLRSIRSPPPPPPPPKSPPEHVCSTTKGHCASQPLAPGKWNDIFFGIFRDSTHDELYTLGFRERPLDEKSRCDRTVPSGDVFS
ncbi:Hypothetical protein CINCED_3A010726 [Cinara cedri]|uniref:Uncharacterized protein n=1 Tax=Cinara cedri TaxID=506608 RepID=A0A5E4NFF5_9HEMI|nr:Hypothetical protein CINCED_3A010726 [Cinara cedri]